MAHPQASLLMLGYHVEPVLVVASDEFVLCVWVCFFIGVQVGDGTPDVCTWSASSDQSSIPLPEVKKKEGAGLGLHCSSQNAIGATSLVQ